MAKQLKIEIARENPEAGNWLYADLELPANEHEIRDAFQRARISTSAMTGLQVQRHRDTTR